MYYSDIFERSVAVGEYIAATGATVRQAAKRFGVGKSTVHKDVTPRLAAADPVLFRAVAEVLESNRAQRHLRGGMATKMRYGKEKVDNSRRLL